MSNSAIGSFRSKVPVIFLLLLSFDCHSFSPRTTDLFPHAHFEYAIDEIGGRSFDQCIKMQAISRNAVERRPPVQVSTRASVSVRRF